MRNRLVTAAILVATTACAAQDLPHTLGAMRDRYRPLLIFAGAADGRVEEQWSTLAAHAAGVIDRQVAPVLLTKSRVGARDGNSPPKITFDDREEVQLRRQFHVEHNEFAVILVGKDGGEKLRSSNPIPWETLESTIDGMPMRQQEMHKRVQ